MIFLTLGTQLPFDRLVRAADDWAGARGRGSEIFGQLPMPDAGCYRPRHFDWVQRLEPEAHRTRTEAARLILSHAGMGTIITALTLGKPLIVMPRRADLREHRNDHQIATALHFASRPGILVAETAEALAALLDDPATLECGGPGGLSPHADPGLIAAVRAAIIG